MASLHSFKTMHSSTFHLPPALRVAAFNRSIPTSRTFSSTARRDVDAISILTSGPVFLMDSLHSLGLSWTTVIPCTALILRGGLTHVFFTLPQKKHDRQRAAVTPLINAYTNMLLRDPNIQKLRLKLQKEGLMGGALKLHDAVVKSRMGFKAWWEIGWLAGQSRLRRWSRPFANFGILITAMEAIRLKCGSTEGLLAILFRPLAWVGPKIERLRVMFFVPGGLAEYDKKMGRGAEGTPVSPGSSSVSDAATASGTVAASQQPSVQAHSGAESLFEDSTTSWEATAQSDPIPLADGETAVASTSALTRYTSDPTMATEGPWFCPDLTMPDPSGILPVGVFAALAFNAILAPQKLTKGGAPVQTTKGSFWLRPKWETMTGASKVQLCLFAPYFGYIASSMPAGMALYIIANWTLAFVLRVWMDVKYPPARAVEQCLRPVRQRTRRLW